MTTAQTDSRSVDRARSAGEGFVNSRLFEVISRAGFVARALIYGIIGVLAFEVAVGLENDVRGRVIRVGMHRVGAIRCA